MTPLIESVVPTPELLDAPITGVCDERDINQYAATTPLADIQNVQCEIHLILQNVRKGD